MPDGQVIACPTCAKKFKLPDRPPATFTCTGCQTVMDLSAFRAPEPEPARTPAAAGRPSTRRATGGTAAGRLDRPGRAGSARTRARRGEVDEEEGGRAPLPPPKKSMGLVWASLGGLVLIVGVSILAFAGKSKKDAPAPQDGDKKETAAAPGTTPPAAGTPPAVPGAPGTPAGTPATPPPGTPEPGMDGAAPAPSGPYIPFGKIEIHAVDHHPDATDEEKHKIDDLINVAIFQNSGADGRRAELELVSIGVKAAPRLINVFYTVKSSEGFGNREGNSKAQIADSVLRRIDGHIERRGSPRITPIRFSSDEKHVTGIVKRWLSWWDNKLYLDPRKPWDERVDGNREDAEDKPADDAAMKAPDAPPDGK